MGDSTYEQHGAKHQHKFAHHHTAPDSNYFRTHCGSEYSIGSGQLSGKTGRTVKARCLNIHLLYCVQLTESKELTKATTSPQFIRGDIR